MSEYQYIHFVACDGPVDEAGLTYMRRQSTRAAVTPWEFTNEYHFGDFRGRPAEMLRRGYDAHLHFANFGIRQLMFRLPHAPCDPKTFARFAVEDCVTWEKDKRGKAGILTISPEADAGTYGYLDDVSGSLHRLVALRDMLLAGDLRPLYVGWLACCYDKDRQEPPVPAGLEKLPRPLADLAAFYELPRGLLEAAARTSPAAPKRTGQTAAAEKWLRGLRKAELQEIVRRLVTDDAGAVRADVLGRIRKHAPAGAWPLAEPSRTLGELHAAAGKPAGRKAR